MNRFDGPKQRQKFFPTTKIVVRPKVEPSQRPDVVRIRFLERPMRFYKAMTYHWRALLHVSIISFLLVYPSYWMVWRIQKNHANAEVMGRMDAGFQSDQLKRQIRSFKKRKAEGNLESYYEATGEQINEGNHGLAKGSRGIVDNELRK